jgi:TAT (twin-arginine translocation) pathway signal sequence/Ferritin-like domain
MAILTVMMFKENKILKNQLSRRNFLKGAGAAAGAVALANYTSLFGISTAFAQAADDDTQTIINLAATAELFATTHYLAAINGDLGLAEAQVNYLKTGFLAEQDHLELLMSLGATPLFTEFYVPEMLFSDVDLFSQITEVAETTFVSAYLAATRIFAAAGATPFAVTTAQIAAVEAEHRALVRQIGGRIANNIPYAQYQFNNVSDAVPVLMPFLDGSGEGFVGPVQPPTAADIAAVRAESEALGYDNTVQPFAAM